MGKRKKFKVGTRVMCSVTGSEAVGVLVPKYREVGAEYTYLVELEGQDPEGWRPDGDEGPKLNVEKTYLWANDEHLTALVPEPTPAAPAPAISEHQRRKEAPVFSGFVAYFPDAIMEMARLSRVGNEQHHPGAPLHWEFGKSADHQDCMLRHAIDFDEDDSDGVLHATKEAWRANANLQTLLEKRDPELHARRQAQRDRAARGERG